MNAQSKIKVLENYLALDLAIFGKDHNKVDVCCPILKEEYVRAKGALVSCIIDLYKHVDKTASKKLSESMTPAHVASNAAVIAKNARKNSKDRILSESTKKQISSVIQESFKNSKTKKRSDIKDIIESQIKTVGFAKIVDEILIRPVLKESNVSSFKDSKGAIMLKAYRTLRENFVKSAMTLLES